MDSRVVALVFYFWFVLLGCITYYVWLWLCVIICVALDTLGDALFVDLVSLAPCSKVYLPQVICGVIKFSQPAVDLQIQDVQKFPALSTVFSNVMGWCSGLGVMAF